jgi:hypothetical protein
MSVDTTQAVNISPEFLRAGRAIFTVANASGDHYTFRIVAAGLEEDNPRWFAQLLTGPDNEHDYTYLGCYNPVTGDVRLTAASKMPEDSQPVRVLRWACKIVRAGRPLPAGYAIRHEGRCGRCGRTLTEPRSLECGIGPECRRKMTVFEIA